MEMVTKFDPFNYADHFIAAMFMLARWGEDYNARLRFEMLYLGLDY